MTDYPEAFETFWQAWGRVPNQSKTDALKAWKKVEKNKSLPPIETLLACVRSYKEELTKENRRKPEWNRRPQCHAATWLRQERFEGYMPSQDHATAPCSPVQPDSLPAKGRDLRDKIGPHAFDVWFNGASFEDDKIVLPKKFHADWVRTNYWLQIERVFGPDMEVRSKW